MNKEILDLKVKITTGDGAVYEFPYDITERNLDFNIAEFAFLNTEGIFVNREMPRATRYDLPIYFKSDNYLDDIETFLSSAKDRRFWIVDHPLHGIRNMHPLSISIDPSSISFGKLTISLVETITEDGLLIDQDFKTNLKTSYDELSEINNAVTASEIEGNVTEINTLTETANEVNTDLQSKIGFQDVADKYSDLFYQLNTKVGNLATDPIEIMQTISNMLLMPSQFIDTIKSRLEFIKSEFEKFFQLVSSLSTIYSAQFFGAAVLSAYSVSTIPDDESEYQSADEIDEIATELWTMYTQYVNEVQSKQTVNGYMPEYKIYYALYVMMVYTINNLYAIAMQSPLVIEIELADDTNAVILSHKYDIDIDQMFILNNWSVKQTLSLVRGDKFKYYV